MQAQQRKKTVLITGASGLLGATALAELREHYKVFGSYRSHPIKLEGTECFQLDINDPHAVEDCLAQIKPDVILHTAAMVNVDECEDDRSGARKANVLATELFAEFAETRGAKLVYISTDAFFDGPQDKYFSETDEPSPMNYYGETKLAAERLIQTRVEDCLIIRTNFYGWNYQNKESLAEWMLHRAEKKVKTPAVHDVYYTPILTNRVVRIINALCEKEERGIFNIAGSRSISKLEFGKLLCREFKLDDSVLQPTSVKQLNLKAKRSSNMSLSIEKLRRHLPMFMRTLEEDLAEFKKLRIALK